MVIGETQMLGQLRAAYALARDEGTVGSVLHDLAQRALRVGKRVHSETGIDRAGASLVSVALDHAEARIGTLAGPPRARRRRRLDGRARRRDAVPPWRRRSSSAAAPRPRPSGWPAASVAAPVGLAGLADELAAADVLVTCTGATGLVVDVSSRMAAGPRRPLVVVDLALPRDVDPAVARCPACTYVDLALLRASGRDGQRRRGRRRPDAVLAERDGRRTCAPSGRPPAVAPTVSALRSQAGQVVDAELAAAVDPAARPRRAARARGGPPVHRVVDKLLHEPTVRVKELAASPGRHRLRRRACARSSASTPAAGRVRRRGATTARERR